jgi:hypothetical protein
VAGKSSSRVDLGTFEARMAEMDKRCPEARHDEDSDRGWFTFTGACQPHSLLKQADIVFRARRVHVSSNHFAVRKEQDLVCLHEGLKKIEKLNNFLKQNQYPADIMMPIDWPVHNGWSLLHGAVYLSCPRLVDILLKAGACPHVHGLARDGSSTETPLLLAKKILQNAGTQINGRSLEFVNLSRLRKIVGSLEFSSRAHI